jgi:hypothetical protein
MDDITAIFDIFEKFDMFGKKIELNFRGKPQFTSLLGRIFTWISIALMVAAGGFFGRELIVRESPNTIKSDLYSLNPPGFDLRDKNTFQLAFGLEDSSFTHYVNYSIWRPQVSLTTKK